MKLLSVNIGQQQSLDTPNGPVQTGIIKEPVLTKVHVTELGIEGDAIVDTSVHGGLDQALYLYSREDYIWWEEHLGRKLSPGIFGENLTLSGFGAAPLNIGDRLQINNVIIEISAPRTPCFKLAARIGDSAFIKEFVQAARTGAYARVIKTGEISAGDEVILTKENSGYPSVSDVFKTCHSKNPDLDIVKQALLSPLGRYHKNIIQGIYDKYIG
ncbi:MAG: MOSC domain-containing protein [Cellvibrio sp.]|uniref:MOSC domain-containing protein n=1 Tax=Cellvibrio sp. TaxID=1965322 RepID=UPI0031B4E94F